MGPEVEKRTFVLDLGLSVYQNPLAGGVAVDPVALVYVVLTDHTTFSVYFIIDPKAFVDVLISVAINTTSVLDIGASEPFTSVPLFAADFSNTAPELDVALVVFNFIWYVTWFNFEGAYLLEGAFDLVSSELQHFLYN